MSSSRGLVVQNILDTGKRNRLSFGHKGGNMNDPGLKNIARKLRENGFISFQLNLGEDPAEDAEQ